MKRLYRSKTDRTIAGIFGGIGELFNIDPNLLRLSAVLLFFISGFFPVLVTYIIAWIILPDGKPLEQEIQPEQPQKTEPRKKKSTETENNAK